MNTLVDYKTRLPIEGQSLRGGYTGDAWLCTRCYCSNAGNGLTLFQLSFEREHEGSLKEPAGEEQQLSLILNDDVLTFQPEQNLKRISYLILSSWLDGMSGFHRYWRISEMHGLEMLGAESSGRQF